eukprot:m.493371 g.493371  ORF g.493371 m.493371 type:complete len:747 (-) comp36726_c0_seq1:3-2243(-)
MSLRLVLVSAFSILLGTSAISQITVTNTQTPADLINNILTGSGVTATNILVNGSAAQANAIQPNAAYFNQNGTSFPITDGVILSTGNANVAVGPNNAGGESNNAGTSVITDPDIAAIAAANITNGITVEFDFVATGNYLEFNYVFGSEEYPEFAPPSSSSFNDVFGFFLSGMGISGPYSNGAVNIANVPGSTTPVSINNVNPVTNSTYYVDNQSGLTYGNAIEYDGTTTVLTAFSDLICGETYHIKLGIANVGDQGWDSGVFLEGGSFTTNPVNFTFNSYAPNNTIVEGCSQFANLIFTREGCNNQNDSLIAYINYGGTATNGVDFTLLPDSVLLEPGVDTVIWQIDPFEDGLSEGTESIQLEIITITDTGDTLYSYATFFIEDVPPFTATANDETLFCLTDSTEIYVVPSGGYAPFTYSWSNSITDSSFYYNPTSNGTTEFYVTITDFCGYTAIDTSTIVMNQTLSVDTVLSFPSAPCEPTGAVSAIISGETGAPLHEWTGPGPNSPNSIDATVWENLSSGWYYYMVTDDVCTAEDSVFVDVTPPPVASFSASPQSGCAPLEVVFTNTSQDAVSYEWNFDGNVVTTTNTNPQTQTFMNTALIQLVATDAGGCSDTTYSTVTVTSCGCTDPTAQNYDPNALVDDGSCFYPQPEIFVPNVFTPNEDNQNDVFFIDVKNASDLSFVILNRWGNVLYEGNGLNATWNGYIVGGHLASDGTYFVRYTVTGIDGQEHEGHGFVQLVNGTKP